MNRYTRKKSLLPGLLLGLGLMGGTVQAAEVFLCAGTTNLVMPDGTSVAMWGYAEDDNANLADGCGNPVQVPGPQITVPSADSLLTVHLRNDLPVPTSLVISGQSTSMTPVFFTDANGRSRMRSFTHETTPGGTADYVWNNFQPGSYAYQSGTHVAVQVQMGLYGAANKDAAAGEAYAGMPYDQDVVLFYSEIDPLLHGEIAAGTYGTTGPTSTIDYLPKYFLVNGAPYSASTTPLAAGAAGTRTLLRMYNMSLRTLAPTLLGEHLKIIAEDGSPYPAARTQYSVMLPAGKTRDAILQANAEGSYPLFDRRLSLANAASGPGGMYSYLAVGAGAANRPVAVGDQYNTPEDTPVTIAAPGVLANDTGNAALSATQLSGTTGALAFNADGSFTYTPPANYNGMESFAYTASDGTGTSNVAYVNINVTPVNDPPVSAADSYSSPSDTVLKVAKISGVLANDTDVDGDVLRAVLDTTTTNGTLSLWKGGAFSYTPNPGFSGTDSFTYHAFDGTANGNTVSVTLNITAVNQPPVAVDDAVATPVDTFIKIPVMSNDYDPDGALDWTSVTIVNGPTNVGNTGNTATVNAKGNAIYFKPNGGFVGVETVTYTIRDTKGAVSNVGTVSITVGP